MSNLRKAAQAVVDIWNDPSLAIEPAIEALRQALEQTKGFEAVAWAVDTPYGRGYSYSEELLAAHSELNRPSIDALIAEIEGIVKCAETVMDGDTGDTIYIGEAYPEDDVKAILDKYRSK